MNAALVSIVAKPQLAAMASLVASLPAGDFAEIGVFNGGSAEVLYTVTERQGRTLHLFDTFTGTPNYIPDLDHHKVDGEFAAPYAEANIRGAMPRAKLYVGEYPTTQPEDLGPLAFVHCDCDQYLSYLAVIGRLWPKLVPGGVMLFDDYPYLGGAKKAVNESFDTKTLEMCHGRYFARKGRAIRV